MSKPKAKKKAARTQAAAGSSAGHATHEWHAPPDKIGWYCKRCDVPKTDAQYAALACLGSKVRRVATALANKLLPTGICVPDEPATDALAQPMSEARLEELRGVAGDFPQERLRECIAEIDRLRAEVNAPINLSEPGDPTLDECRHLVWISDKSRRSRKGPFTKSAASFTRVAMREVDRLRAELAAKDAEIARLKSEITWNHKYRSIADDVTQTGGCDCADRINDRMAEMMRREDAPKANERLKRRAGE